MNFYFFIQLAVEAEAKLEEIRMSLASIDNFESHTSNYQLQILAFKRLDQPRTAGLKPENIFEFLCDNDIEVTQDQLDYIFRVLDEDSDGIITYQDFKSAILPKMNAQLKEQAQNHKGYDLPVDMLLPKEIETQLSQFMNQIKQNYLQYQQVQSKIDLNQLDIYDNDNQITVDSLKDWLQQLGKDISDEVLQNFVDIIQGQQQQLQILLDQIYTENEEDYDQNDEQEEEANDEQEEEANDNEEEKEEENDNQEKQQEDIEQIQQQHELESAQQNDAEDDQDVKDSLQNNQQEFQSQELNHNNMDNQNVNNYSLSDIEFEIYEQKKKISQLEILLEIPQSTYRSYIGQLYEQQNREVQYFSRVSYQRKFDESPSLYSNNLSREKQWLDEEIKKEELKQQMLLIQLKNDVKIYSSGLFTDRYQSRVYQSTLSQSKSYLGYSGQKYSGSYKKVYPTSFQRSFNFSNRKF